MNSRMHSNRNPFMKVGATMKKITGVACLMVFLAISCRAMPAMDGPRLYDLDQGRELTGRQALDRLTAARVVIVGEHHTDARYHEVQLEVIRTLYQADKKIAIGLEMFRRQSQADLDRWVDGRLDEAQFKPIYLDNWNFDWHLYRAIFLFARTHKIPMVGLNVDKGVSRQVAYHGFDSLTEAQKSALGSLRCDVTPEYRTYIQDAFDDHAHGGMNFDYFCQAQLMWDTTMAINISNYLKHHPDTTMVVLTGTGHAQKPGIPTQLSKRAPWNVLVIMPQTPNVHDQKSVTAVEADVLWQ